MILPTNPCNASSRLLRKYNRFHLQHGQQRIVLMTENSVTSRRVVSPTSLSSSSYNHHRRTYNTGYGTNCTTTTTTSYRRYSYSNMHQLVAMNDTKQRVVTTQPQQATSPLLTQLPTPGTTTLNSTRRNASATAYNNIDDDNGGGNTIVNQSVNDGDTKKEMNLFTAINHALHIAMETNDSTIIFGQDVAFGGVFRCTQHLQSTFGKDRVFNTPLSEVGIIGLAVGYTATTHHAMAVAEIQFADYIFPALDQICNEVSKFRYRSGNQWDCGGITIRTPYGAVGHGGHYHSQSPESYLCHTPGLTVVVPRSPYTAKGLLLSSIRSPDPVIFLEPKALYRTAIEAVPIGDYELPLSTAEVIRRGHDITLIGWGQQLRAMELACDLAMQTHNIHCEIVDVQTLVPCDYETMIQSVQKTGKCVIVHEAPITLGFGAELCATIQQECFYSLQVPITRICGYDIPFPLVHEKYYVPDTYKIYDAILTSMELAK